MICIVKQVKETLNLRFTPSAFQIRFGGCKGVVALAPDIGEEEKLQIRKSMEKFPSEHNHIEVVETTRPGLYVFQNIVLHCIWEPLSTNDTLSLSPLLCLQL